MRKETAAAVALSVYTLLGTAADARELDCVSVEAAGRVHKQLGQQLAGEFPTADGRLQVWLNATGIWIVALVRGEQSCLVAAGSQSEPPAPEPPAPREFHI